MNAADNSTAAVLKLLTDSDSARKDEEAWGGTWT